jgi:hypothetical protein
MKEMDPLHFFLGIEIDQDASSIKLFQTKYAKDLWVIFHMIDYKFATTPLFFQGKARGCRDTPLVGNTLY